SSDAKLLSGSSSGSIAVADFNGDAKPDLAMGDGSATILLGNGDGTLQAPVSSTNTVAFAVAVGDFNADGKPDLATRFEYLNVLLGNGDGTLQAAATYGLGGSYPTSVAVGDINADGKLDLVATSYSGDAFSGFTGYVNVLLGYGNGTFAAAQATTVVS